MLVLTRRVGEEIVIDGSIRITVTAIQGERVRIGITAPEFVRVDRSEVHQRRKGFAAADLVPDSETEVCYVRPGVA
jgi:carbon storage regulator